MPNKGQQLEQLVRAIEKSLLPKGFEVLGNERVYSEEGVQIAEFDIEVRGKVGSTLFKWLIECRDRPAGGLAPGSWVEQLVGRRSRFKFDKVTAVSTTGFTQGAADYAKSEGIELRTVETLTIDDIRKWFLGSNLYLRKSHGKLIHADLILEDSLNHLLKRAAESKIKGSDSNKPMLVSKKNGESISVSEAWGRILKGNPQIFSGIEPGRNPSRKTIRTHFPEAGDRFQLETEAGNADIIRIIFRAELSVAITAVPISKIIQYRNIEAREPICQTIQFEFEIDDEPVELSIHKLDQEEGMLLGVQATRLKKEKV